MGMLYKEQHDKATETSSSTEDRQELRPALPIRKTKILEERMLEALRINKARRKHEAKNL